VRSPVVVKITLAVVSEARLPLTHFARDTRQSRRKGRKAHLAHARVSPISDCGHGRGSATMNLIDCQALFQKIPRAARYLTLKGPKGNLQPRLLWPVRFLAST
jgi:hypothetical protein